jgi:Zn-dependent protease with chaperone function
MAISRTREYAADNMAAAFSASRPRTQGYGKWGQSAARRGPWG